MPEEIEVGGKTFTVAKRYANQYKGEVFPAVTLNFRNLSEPKTLNLDRVRRKEYITTDTIVYDSNTEGSFEVSKAAGSRSAGLNHFDPIYSIVHDAPVASTPHVVGDNTNLVFGQDGLSIPGLYSIDRIGLIFETNGVPTLVQRSDIILLSATLKVYILTIIGGAAPSTKLVIQTGLPNYPSTPVVVGDYLYSQYSGNKGELSLSGVSTGYYDITISDLSFIQRGGYTKMMLRSDKDIASADPGMNDERAEIIATSTGANKTTLELGFAYRLSIDYAYEIVRVVGTVGGSEYTFDPSEYQLVEENITGYYKSIQFLGPTYPDDGTSFTVEYKHAWVRSWQGGEFRDIVSVEVWAKDSEIDTPSGDKRFINGMLIVQELVEIFTQWFRYFCDDLSDEFTVDSVTEARDLDSTIEGEEERRRQFDVYIAHVESVEKTKVATIETVDTPDYTVE